MLDWKVTFHNNYCLSENVQNNYYQLNKIKNNKCFFYVVGIFYFITYNDYGPCCQ